MIALAEKGLEYELKQVKGNDPELIKKYHSIHVDSSAGVMVPVLEHETDQGPVNIIESIPITEYVEDAFPNEGNSLQPSSAKQKNQVRMFLELATKLNPFGVCFAKYENLDKAIKDFATAAKNTNAALEKWGEPGGDFLLGDKFSMAEVLTAPMIVRLSAFEWFHGINAVEMMEQLGHARLAKWVKAVMARSSVKSTYHEGERKETEAYLISAGATPGKITYVVKDGTVAVTHLDGKPYTNKPGGAATKEAAPSLIPLAIVLAIVGISYLRK